MTPIDAAPVRFLDPDGSLHPVSSDDMARLRGVVEEIDDEQIHRMYRGMVLSRRIDREAALLQRRGELALWVSAEGQEGIQAGVGVAARPQDWVVPSYRELTLALLRGVRVEDLLALMRGTTRGAWDWKSTRVHPYTLVIGAQATHGVGLAMGLSLGGRSGSGDASVDEAVVTCFGDGATSEGAVSEALVFAASFHAPVVFLCQSNGWAISVPTRVQSVAPLSDRARGFGLDAIRVDGNDPLASFAAARVLLDSARSGGGPGFIEAITYRMGAHTSSDAPTKYRDDAEVAQWAGRDPILRLERFLRRRGEAETFFEDVAMEAEEEALRMRRTVPALPDPDPETMFANVYATANPLVDSEREWFSHYRSAEGGRQ